MIFSRKKPIPVDLNSDGREMLSPEAMVRLAVTGAIAVVMLLALGSWTAGSSVTQINAGEIGVIINNLTGRVSVQQIPGMVFHLPWGIAEVHKFDSKLQTLALSGETAKSDAAGGNRIKIKTRDGSDVHIDAVMTYTIDPDAGQRMAQEIGVGRSVPDPQILISYARTLVRNELGRLSIDETIDATQRSLARQRFEQKMVEELAPFGIQLNTATLQNPNFNPQFEQLIKDRKAADQELVNQDNAQKNVQSNQTLRISEADRERQNALRQEEGVQNRRIIGAQAAAEERKKRAEGEAYRLRVDGQRSRDVAMQEAEATRSEGLARAEGLRRLAEAYAQGGMGMVREALAEKFTGAVLSGRPYSQAGTIDRLKIEGLPPLAAAPTPAVSATVRK